MHDSGQGPLLGLACLTPVVTTPGRSIGVHTHLLPRFDEETEELEVRIP